MVRGYKRVSGEGRNLLGFQVLVPLNKKLGGEMQTAVGIEAVCQGEGSFKEERGPELEEKPEAQHSAYPACWVLYRLSGYCTLLLQCSIIVQSLWGWVSHLYPFFFLC